MRVFQGRQIWGFFHQEALLRTRWLANVLPTAAADLRAPTRPPGGSRWGPCNRRRTRATPRAQLAASRDGAASRTEPKSRRKHELADRGRKSTPEAAPKLEHGGRSGPPLEPEPSQGLAATTSRALPPPGGAQAGRRHRIPEHLQPGQALPGIAGRGHRLEGPGEPGGPDGRGVSSPLAGDVGKPGPYWACARFWEGAAAEGSWLPEQPRTGTPGRVSAPWQTGGVRVLGEHAGHSPYETTSFSALVPQP